jgi:membrane protein DedA with SNARE-associated domain
LTVATSAGGLIASTSASDSQHQSWAPPIVFILAFGESLAFISLLLPATVILFDAGRLVGAARIGFWPVWVAATFGAVAGDWLSYWLGYRYEGAIGDQWPIARHPNLLRREEVFFRRWGTLGVFVGPFFGPLRSTTPLGEPRLESCML